MGRNPKKHQEGNQGGKHSCRLNHIKSGRKARIRCHHSTGSVRQRLLDLGFVPESEIDVVRRAPLGDPIQCRVAGYNVTLRASEADLIEVEATDSTDDTICEQFKDIGKKCRLHEMDSGRKACIRCHHSTGSVRQRLLDLGFVPGSKIDVVRRAPLGDPIQCRVAGYNVTLRASEAELIEVEVAA